MRSLFALLCLSITAPTLMTRVEAHEVPKPAAVRAPLPAAASDAAIVVEAFHQSLKNGDLCAASALLATNALIYESGGVEHGKAEYILHHLPADVEFAKATVRTVAGQSGNAIDDLAWIATESRTTGSYKGRAIDSISTETMVLRRFGKVWKIVHIHWSSGK